MSIIKEFKEFAFRGNLIDIAVGFVMGAAFSRLTSVFIDGMVMPLVGLIQSKDVSHWKWIIKPRMVDAQGTELAAEISIKYGMFLTVAIEFLLVAWVMFLVIKGMNMMRRREPPPAPAEPPAQEKLLMEIRDLLKK